MGILESRAIYTLASGKHSLSTADTTKVEEILNAPPTDCDVCSSEVYHSQIWPVIATGQLRCKLFGFYLLNLSQFCLEISSNKISHAAKQG